MPNNVNLTVYAPKDAAWQVIDKDLQKEVPEEVKVIRRKVFEPHKYLGKKGGAGIGFTQDKKPSLIKRLTIWIRGNLFIPDSRVFWIRPSARFLNNYLKQNPEIKTVISSGPPHSIHLIARKLKQKHAIQWIADFRDPWTQIDFYQDLLPGKRADKKHKRLEKMVLTEADEVLTVSKSCAEGLEDIANRDVHIVTNGFIFPEFNEKEVQLDQLFTISHFGSMPFARNPLILWKALNTLLESNQELQKHLRIQLIGTVDYQVLESAKEHGLENYLELVPPVKHSESIRMQRTTQLLLLVANNTGNVKGILTGKFFEYLGAKRPILSIGTKGSDLETAVNHTKSGFFADYEDLQGTIEFIENSFNSYLSNSLWCTPQNTADYNSETLAKKIIELL